MNYVDICFSFMQIYQNLRILSLLASILTSGSGIHIGWWLILLAFGGLLSQIECLSSGAVY